MSTLCAQDFCEQSKNSTINLKMNSFNAANPRLKDFVQSNSSFSLSNIYGINHQRKEISKEFLAVLEEQHHKDIVNYIKTFGISKEEVVSVLSSKTGDEHLLDNAQRDWLISALIRASTDSGLNVALKNRIGIELVQIRVGHTSGISGMDFSNHEVSSSFSSAVNLNSGSIDAEVYDLIFADLEDLVEAATASGANHIKLHGFLSTIPSSALKCSLKSGEDNDLDNWEAIGRFLLAARSRGDLSKPDAPKNLQKRANILIDKLSDVINFDSCRSVESMTITSSEHDRAIDTLGSLTENTSGDLNYCPAMDYTGIAKRIADNDGYQIATLHENALITNARRIAEAKERRAKAKADKNAEHTGGSSSSFYDFVESRNDAVRGRDNEIKSITFRRPDGDSKGKPVFTHHPNYRAHSWSNGKGSVILFEKDIEITAADAKLMVAQFMSTNKSGRMVITPPQDKTEKLTQKHVYLIIAAAIELGVDPDLISMPDNQKMSQIQFNQIKIGVIKNHATTSPSLSMNGGLHCGEDSDNELEPTMQHEEKESVQRTVSVSPFKM